MNESTQGRDALKHGTGHLLYVVLQGEFVLYADEYAKQLRILAPELKDHVYLAGPWLGETPIDPHLKLCLTNVIGGKATPQDDESQKLFLRLPGGKLCPEKARIDITAPLPIAILAGRRETTDTVKITIKGQDPQAASSPNPTIVPILVYEWDPLKPLPLLTECTKPSGDTEPKSFSPGGDVPHKSLHLYASGLEPEDKPHAQHAFSAAARLLGLDATIDWNSDVLRLVDPIANDAPPRGLLWYQINYLLNDRHLLTSQLGAMMRGQAAQFPPFKIEASHPRFDSGNCGSITN
jgi:hypothetical protein